MKIKLLFLSAVLSAFSLTNVSAQTTKISFESSESFTLGGVNNQNGWQVWSDDNSYPMSSAAVVNTLANDGSNSLKMLNEAVSYQHLSGVKKDVSSLTTGQDYEVSVDHLVETTNNSGFPITIFNDSNVNYQTGNITAGFLLITGTIPAYFEGDGAPGFGPTMNVGEWHNYKIVIKKSDNTLAYYLDGTLLYSGTLGVNKNIHHLDFSFDNYGSGFAVDNIKITNISANLAVGEQASLNNDISVFPNPTSDVVNIKAASTIASVDILDLKGSLVRNYNDGKSQINISDLPKGVYMLKVKTKTTELTKKIIKN